MKKYILSAIAVICALAMTSCSDFLQPQPEGQPTTTQYFTSDQQAIDAVDAFLLEMTRSDPWYGREYQWIMYETNMGVIGKTKGWGAVLGHNYDGNSEKEPIAEPFYCATKYAARANFVVQGLKAKEGKNNALTYIEKRSLGEALFWRALYHWVLAFRHGLPTQGVPFVNYEKVEGGYNYSIPKQQATVMEDYQMVIDDLKEAATYLPTIEQYSAAEKGRASADAAVALQAKVYAYWAAWDASKWNNVIEVVNKLEGAPYNRGLIADYEDLFTYDKSKWANKEEILGIYCHAQDTGTGGTEWAGVMFEDKGWGKWNGWGQGRPSQDLYDTFAEDDDNLIDPAKGNIRKKRTIIEYGDMFKYCGEDFYYYSAVNLNVGFMCGKYIRGFELGNSLEECMKAGGCNEGGDWPITTCVVPILRFADCMLLRAEAYIMTNQAGKAADDINKIRNRGNVKSLVGTPTMADIYHERRVELAFEITDPFQDLRRWSISPNAEIKRLALAELTAKPRVRYYKDRAKAGEWKGDKWVPNTDYTIDVYEDCNYSKTWSDEKIVYPYPQGEVDKSNGALKQNPGY